MAWIAAIIGAAATYYGSQQQEKATSRIGHEQDRLYGIQADNAEALAPYARDFYSKASQAANPVLGYNLALASGDEAKTYSALSPQLAAIGRKYRTMFNASSELNQRGGMSSSYAAELPFRAADEKQALVSGERRSAYGNLSSLFGQFANAGGGAAGGSQNAATGASNALNNNMWLAMQTASGRSKAYGELGEAISSMFGYDKGSGWYIGNNPGRG